AERLDHPAVALRLRVRRTNAIGRVVQATEPGQTQLDGQVGTAPSSTAGSRGGRAGSVAAHPREASPRRRKTAASGGSLLLRAPAPAQEAAERLVAPAAPRAPGAGIRQTEAGEPAEPGPGATRHAL